MTPVPSKAFAASQVVSTVSCILYGVACTIASAGTYYLLILDATSAPADSSDVTGGSFGTYLVCVPVTTTAANQTVDVDFSIGGGILSASGVRCAKGCVVELSSTAPTSTTGVTSGLWCNGRIG